MIVHHNIETKLSLLNTRSTYLWHKCLWNIFQKRIKKLVNNKILLGFNFIDLNVCVECTKITHKEMIHIK